LQVAIRAQSQPGRLANFCAVLKTGTCYKATIVRLCFVVAHGMSHGVVDDARARAEIFCSEK